MKMPHATVCPAQMSPSATPQTMVYLAALWKQGPAQEVRNVSAYGIWGASGESLWNTFDPHSDVIIGGCVVLRQSPILKNLKQKAAEKGVVLQC
ncbi:hypothetical protein LEMLEM_LOCUS18634, partial [Lemmus lemmus]